MARPSLPPKLQEKAVSAKGLLCGALGAMGLDAEGQYIFQIGNPERALAALADPLPEDSHWSTEDYMIDPVTAGLQGRGGMSSPSIRPK